MGRRPYSTFLAESLPANKQPSPMPIPSAATGKVALKLINLQFLETVRENGGRDQAADRPDEDLPHHG